MLQPQSDSLHEYYQNEKNCFTDLGLAREAFGNTTTTEEEYDQMEKSLALMFFHCPKDMTGIVEATMFEAGMRRPYFNFNS